MYMKNKGRIAAKKKLAARKTDWKVLIWLNDFPNESIDDSYYGKDGLIANKINKCIAPKAELEFSFFGGFYEETKIDFATEQKMETADVIFCYPWNMSMNNIDMHWPEAGKSQLEILTNLKLMNENLKIFFIREPYHFREQFEKLGEFVSGLEDQVIYDYFQKR